MFGLLGSLFGTAKAGEAMIAGVTNGIDKLFYTGEEQAEAKAKARTEGMTVYMAWLASTSGSRLARRVLALSVTSVWIIEHMMAVLFDTMAVFTNNAGALTSDKLVTASLHMNASADSNRELVAIVLLFYFGGPAAIDGVKALATKWSANGKTKGTDK